MLCIVFEVHNSTAASYMHALWEENMHTGKTPIANIGDVPEDQQVENLDFLNSLKPDEKGRYSVILVISVEEPSVSLEESSNFGSPSLPNFSFDEMDTQKSEQIVTDALELVEKVTNTPGKHLKSAQSIVVRATPSQIAVFSKSPLFKTVLPNTVHK